MPKSKDKRQTIKLNVVLFGEKPDQIFNIRIASDWSVSDLRQLVRKNKLPILDAISHTDIKLCRVDLSGFEQLPLDAFMNEIRRVIPAKGLPPATLIRTIFPSGSPEQEGKIHIIAVLPDVFSSI
ncbi:hypothetical protein BD779DRAFT_1578272 [Infundibulicybe gibba]|nr:hypothetical protein BD779DRAFT_1578272 [Infundibulicybe gibba]